MHTTRKITPQLAAVLVASAQLSAVGQRLTSTRQLDGIHSHLPGPLPVAAPVRMHSIMNVSIKNERRMLFAAWATAVVAGVVGGPSIAAATGQPGWVFLGLMILAVVLGFWHRSFRRRSRGS